MAAHSGSSVPGGGYQGGWNGTSMSGPHVAGIVALMRQANPDADVATIKQVLMDTALDRGIVGQDNDYGHGVVDAYAAVTAVSASRLNRNYEVTADFTLDVPDDAQNIAEGERLYTIMCQSCHGKNLAGQTWSDLMSGEIQVANLTTGSGGVAPRGSFTTSPLGVKQNTWSEYISSLTCSRNSS